MRELWALAEKAAQTDANVYIYGENGSGKELLARSIHYGGARRRGPLVTLDCTTIPSGLMESQLFGHVRGAFTGAVGAHSGVLAAADGGTLFIDEIGELSLPLQAKLLRCLQFREFTPVGGGQSRRVDVRFIAATNRNLRQAVTEGKFRSDLYHRIGVIHLVVPPLRDRREDIPALVEHFSREFAAKYGQTVRALTPEALFLLESYDWPGNVRQLQNAIEQAVIFARAEVLTVDAFREVIDIRRPASTPDVPPRPSVSLPGFSGKSLRELEEWYILEMLNRFRGNRTRTAKFVGLSLRSLQYKLKRYDAQRSGQGETSRS